MKKSLIIGLNILILSLLSFTVSGCASHGYKTANHNGKLYYFPQNCSRYRYSYSNPDLLHCQNDGELTGQTITPADNAQVSNHRYQQKQEKEAWDSLNRSLEKTNENLRKQNEAYYKNNVNVYHHY
jgi:hypothetical protein